MTAAYGFFGKIPDRGDFVRHGLPQGFLTALDAWWQQVLPGSAMILGEAWSDAWMEAPIWRFTLAPGVCGPYAAAGVWMPSTDKVGRLFPLTFVVVGEGWMEVAQCGAFLGAAEQAGLRALDDTLTPADLIAAVERSANPGGDTVPPTASGMSAWWTAGSPRVPPCRQQMNGLPDDRAFAAMLDSSHASGRPFANG